MAKSLIRNRHSVTKLYGLKSQLQAIGLRIQTLKSTQAMADAMMGATKVRGGRGGSGGGGDGAEMVVATQQCWWWCSSSNCDGVTVRGDIAVGV